MIQFKLFFLYIFLWVSHVYWEFYSFFLPRVQLWVMDVPKLGILRLPVNPKSIMVLLKDINNQIYQKYNPQQTLSHLHWSPVYGFQWEKMTSLCTHESGAVCAANYRSKPSSVNTSNAAPRAQLTSTSSIFFNNYKRNCISHINTLCFVKSTYNSIPCYVKIMTPQWPQYLDFFLGKTDSLRNNFPS